MKWYEKSFRLIRKWLGWEKPTVVLIAGVGGFGKSFLNLGKVIEGWGFPVVYAKVQSMDRITKMAEEIKEIILKEKPKRLFLIGHSKGGLTARYLIAKYPEINKLTEKIILIATPNKGTVWGFLPIEGLTEMANGSDFLKQVEGKNLEKIVNFYPKVDEKVIPNSGLTIDGARNIMIETVGHDRILRSPKLTEEIKMILK